VRHDTQFKTRATVERQQVLPNELAARGMKFIQNFDDPPYVPRRVVSSTRVATSGRRNGGRRLDVPRPPDD
jgi:hypothetical protein